MPLKPSYEELEKRVSSLTRENHEISMMLKAIKTIPLSGTFEESARHIYHILKTMTGATCGYVALMTEDGHENEVLFLDDGDLPCNVDPDLPMPIRGLRAVAYETGNAAYENDFQDCHWMKFMPPGHVPLRNVMFAPLNFGNKTVGVIGLANKPDGFSEYDKKVAQSFGDIAALALRHSRSLEMLEESKAFCVNLLSKSPNPIVVLHPDRSVRFVNQAFENLTGFAADDVIGLKDPYPWWTKETIPKIRGDFDKALVHGALKHEELFRKKTGEVFSVEITSKPVFKGDELQYYLANWVDITHRKRADADIRELNERFSIAVDSAGIGVWELDLKNDVLSWDDWMYRLYGVDPDVFEGAYNAWQKGVHPEDLDRADGLVQQAIHGGKPFDTHFRIVRPDGEIRYIKAFAKVLRNEGGIPIKMTGVNYDITEQKAVVQSLMESEHKWRQILVHTPQIGISLDPHAGIVFVNESFLSLTGWEREVVIGRDWFDMFIPEKARDEVREVFRKVMTNNKTSGFSNFENEIITRSGELLNIAWSNVLTKDVRGNVVDVTCLGVDLTERHRSEKALRKSELKYRTMMETIKDPVYISSDHYRIQYMNQAMIERIGRDGTGEYCYNALYDFDKTCPWCNQGKLHEKGRDMMDVVSPKDKRSFSVSSALLNNDDGSVSKISVLRDTTDYKLLQDQLQKAQKMESIGNLAGGIAHDFNNILFPIIGMSEMLLEDLPAGSLEYQNVQQILKAGERGSDLIEQILAFSRQSDHKMMPVRVQQIVKEVLKLSRSTIPSNIEISQFLQSDCGFVMADVTQLHQVSMNLITNAYHAVEQKGGKIFVGLTETSLSAHDSENPSLKPGDYVLLSVSDTGCGIDPTVMDRIFDPYFTTKDRKKGTGLGLAVVFGIVKEHGGDIRVQSELEKGTTFDVYLPLLAESPQTESMDGPKISPRGTERILLVDDEDMVLRLERMTLERLGYQVECRNSSIAALGAFGADPDAFDLVITDMAMPKMTGDQLTEQLLLIRPEIPIILLTGFSERMNWDIASRIGIKGFLLKPVRKLDLARMVRKLLDEAEKTH